MRVRVVKYQRDTRGHDSAHDRERSSVTFANAAKMSSVFFASLVGFLPLSSRRRTSHRPQSSSPLCARYHAQRPRLP